MNTSSAACACCSDEPAGFITGRKAKVSETRIPWGRLAAAAAFAALSETFEFLGEWLANPLRSSWPSLGLDGVGAVEWLPLVFAVVAILAAGLSTYKRGWIALKKRELNMDALMSVAVTGAALIGRYPEAAMVMVLFTLAEAIEEKALDRARKAVQSLLAFAPEQATVRQADGSWLETEVGQVTIGSLVRVRPGERVALDGVIVRGQSAVNQSPITGESLPAEKTIGDPVYAGTINESGSFEFEVTAGAGHTTLARIIQAMEEAQGTRAPIQRFVDRFAACYTPAVLIMAVLTSFIPPLFMHWTWSASIYAALVLLVISCPCALVISTPVTIVSGLARAARGGILIKGGIFLEQGRLLVWLALDKTGTVTHGKPRWTDFAVVGGFDGNEAFSLAAGLAARSDHPVSKAIAQAADEKGLLPAAVDEFAALPGQGVSGLINGQKWLLGNRRLFEERRGLSPALEEQIVTLERQGKSVVVLIGENGPRALFAVADTVKESSLAAVRDLKRLGLKIIMLTGDNEHAARVIAGQAGVDSFKSNLLPEDKLAVVEELAKSGKVGMVGDGINDAPALARADIGFAMAANGTDTAIEAADVTLMDDDLLKIPRFIRLSKAVHSILVQNMALALGLKAVFLGLAFRGQATMWMAVFADVGVCLLVVANALRVLRK